jgi:3-oxoacyl-[acyl-carrier protein] reductase
MLQASPDIGGPPPVPRLTRDRCGPAVPDCRDVAAFTGGIVGPHYAASKAGLHGLTHFLASRLAATVNALAPALVAETGMLPGNPAELRRQVPVGRLGQPSEVAGLAATMLVNAYLTNQVISLDGGIHPR